MSWYTFARILARADSPTGGLVTTLCSLDPKSQKESSTLGRGCTNGWQTLTLPRSSLISSWFKIASTTPYTLLLIVFQESNCVPKET